MSLTFACDYCKSSYRAQPSLHGFSYFELTADEEKRHLSQNEHDPCYVCTDEAERAKQEVLEKKKQKP